MATSGGCTAAGQFQVPCQVITSSGPGRQALPPPPPQLRHPPPSSFRAGAIVGELQRHKSRSQCCWPPVCLSGDDLVTVASSRARLKSLGCDPENLAAQRPRRPRYTSQTSHLSRPGQNPNLGLCLSALLHHSLTIPHISISPSGVCDSLSTSRRPQWQNTSRTTPWSTPRARIARLTTATTRKARGTPRSASETRRSRAYDLICMASPTTANRVLKL